VIDLPGSTRKESIMSQERCSGVRFIGPLTPFAEGFRSELGRCWYAESTAIEQLRLISLDPPMRAVV
jgi:hypothetical protein